MNGYRCNSCGKLHHPARLVCDKCSAREFETVELVGEGELLTHTRLFNLPVGINKDFLDFGVVALDAGVCVTGQLDVEGEIKTGMKLTVTEGVIREIHDTEYVGFIFKKA